MTQIKTLLPQGRKKVFTLSYDDGVIQDKKLVEILNRYGIKATFNLNSGIQSEESVWFDNGVEVRRMNKENLRNLYKGHEVALHSLTHPHLEELSREEVVKEIFEDRRNLEAQFGYLVRGAAYPFGTYNDVVIEVLKDFGVEYSRTVNDTEKFSMPEKPLEWEPTCHHNNPRLMEFAGKFLSKDLEDIALFYVWGHSYEFDVDQNWQLIEQFCEFIGNRKEVWYAANIEIIDYLKAVKALVFSAEATMVYNPSALTVWISVNDHTMAINPGETVNIT